MSSTDDDLQASLDEALDEHLEAEVDDLGDDSEPVEVSEPALEPHPMWDARFKEAFTEMGQREGGRTYQQAMLDMYKEQRGYATTVEQERAEARKQAEQYQQYVSQFSNAVQPYQQFITDIGSTPDQVIRQSLGMLQQMRRDPKQFIQHIAKSANLDLGTLAHGEEWVDPVTQEVSALKQQLGQIQHQNMLEKRQMMQQHIDRIKAENEQEISAFASATDASGNPLHPFLADVQDEMAELIYGREAQRRMNPRLPPLSLSEAYSKACKTSDKVSQADQSSRETARLSEAAQKAKKAADASKRTKSGSTGTNRAKLTLDQQLEEAMAAQG